MKSRACFVASLLAMTILAAPAFAETPEARFYEGNRLYAEGKFAEAAAEYEKILASSLESAALHFNLGNCFYKLGQKGKAVLHYEKGLRLSPRDRELLYNLELLRLQLEDKIAAPPRNAAAQKFGDWIARYSEREWCFFFLAGQFVFFGAALARLFAPSRRKKMRAPLAAAGAAAALLAACLAAKFSEEGKSRGVVVVSSVEARYGPSPRDVAAFTLHEGTVFAVAGGNGEWAQIRLADGKGGWIPRSAFEKI